MSRRHGMRCWRSLAGEVVRRRLTAPPSDPDWQKMDAGLSRAASERRFLAKSGLTRRHACRHGLRCRLA
jgi:hypothetical protein